MVIHNYNALCTFDSLYGTPRKLDYPTTLRRALFIPTTSTRVHVFGATHRDTQRLAPSGTIPDIVTAGVDGGFRLQIGSSLYP